jgi:hypothetical protein
VDVYFEFAAQNLDAALSCSLWSFLLFNSVLCFRLAEPNFFISPYFFCQFFFFVLMEMGQPGIATRRGLIVQHGSELQVGFYLWDSMAG